MEPRDPLVFLDQVFSAEQAMLAPRLVESTVYVSDADVQAHTLLTKLSRSARGRAAALAELIQSLGGVPSPARHSVATAGLHFQELHAVWPELVAERNSIIDLYARVSPALSSKPAASLLRSLQAEHVEELEAIRRFVPVPA